MECHCVKAKPVVRPFGSTYCVLCAVCGRNLTADCAPDSKSENAAALAVNLEVRGDTFLSRWERDWIHERRKISV